MSKFKYDNISISVDNIRKEEHTVCDITFEISNRSITFTYIDYDNAEKCGDKLIYNKLFELNLADNALLVATSYTKDYFSHDFKYMVDNHELRPDKQLWYEQQKYIHEELNKILLNEDDWFEADEEVCELNYTYCEFAKVLDSKFRARMEELDARAADYILSHPEEFPNIIIGDEE